MTIDLLYDDVTLQATLLDAVTATSDGEWIPTRGIYLMSVEIIGISGDTVQIRGTNQHTRPLDTDDGQQLGTDITANWLFGNVIPVTWFKLMVSAYGAGTITARFLGHLAPAAS